MKTNANRTTVEIPSPATKQASAILDLMVAVPVTFDPSQNDTVRKKLARRPRRRCASAQRRGELEGFVRLLATGYWFRSSWIFGSLKFSLVTTCAGMATTRGSTFSPFKTLSMA